MTDKYRITALNPEHQRADFDCGSQALNKYIRSSVLRDIGNRLSRCYVAFSAPGLHVLGFYTLSNHAVKIANLPRKYGRKIPPGYLVPTILLGRLAVDKTHQGFGLGGFLLVDAIRRSLSASKISSAYALVTQAKNDQAVSFYSHFGFLSFSDDPSHLFLPLKTAEVLFQEGISRL